MVVGIEVVWGMCAMDRATGDDLAVRRLAARAEPEAFAALYDLHVDRVYAYAYRMLGDRPRAEDVTAETFTRALQGIGGFQWRGGGFAAWLYRIARNLCYDELRRESRMATAALDEEEGSELAVQGPSPDEQLVGREEGERLRSLVAALPIQQREALVLKYTAGLANTEIAALTGRSETAVSSLLNRAITNLRERYGGIRA